MTTIELDKRNGVAYLRLPDHTGVMGSVKRTTTAAPGVLFDYDEQGRLIGIELLQCRVEEPENPQAHVHAEPTIQ
jgi:YD repeat-containing protein